MDVATRLNPFTSSDPRAIAEAAARVAERQRDEDAAAAKLADSALASRLRRLSYSQKKALASEAIRLGIERNKALSNAEIEALAESMFPSGAAASEAAAREAGSSMGMLLMLGLVGVAAYLVWGRPKRKSSR